MNNNLLCIFLPRFITRFKYCYQRIVFGQCPYSSTMTFSGALELKWDSMLEMDKRHSYFPRHSLSKLVILIISLMLESQGSLFIV